MFARTCVAAVVGFSTAVVTAHATVCLPVATPAGLYAASTDGRLWRIELKRGAGAADATLVGTLGDGATGFYPTDIAFTDSGAMFAVDGTDLACVNPTTAVTSQVAADDAGTLHQTALAGRTRGNGQLYGAGIEGVVVITTSDGAAQHLSDLGSLGCGDEVGDLAFDPAGDVMLGTLECNGGWKGVESHLVVVDPVSGRAVADVGRIVDAAGRGRHATYGLAFGPDGALYAASDATLMRIDPKSGVSKEDFPILSVTPGAELARVDGLASRVCERPDGAAQPGVTVASWAARCPVDYAEADSIIREATAGHVLTACEAIKGVPSASVARSPAEEPIGGLSARRRSPSRVVNREAMRAQSSLAPARACSLAAAEMAAAALNVTAGEIGAACTSCGGVDAGTRLALLTDRLAAAYDADDESTCDAVRIEAHVLAGGSCS